MNQEDPNSLSFTRGNPAEEALPIEEIMECANQIFRDQGKVLFQYGHYSGYGPLREWIAEWYGVRYEQVLIGNSSMEFLTFIGSLMVEKGDTVFIENPSYDRAITAMRRIGANVVGIPLEKDGINLDIFRSELKKGVPKIFYLVPDFQNPSGVSTSLEKRQELSRLADEFGFILVEDAPYRFLRYSGEDIPSFRDIIPEKVLHICSFSKLLSPGLRVGFLVGPDNLMPKVHKWSEDTYIHPTLVTEGIVYEYCRRGLLETNIEKLKALYGPRLKAILNALGKYIEGAEWIKPEGGFFVSITLPDNIDGKALRENGDKYGIVLSDGRGFFTDLKGDNFIRLPFCALSLEEIEEGIKRLATAINANK